MHYGCWRGAVVALLDVAAAAEVVDERPSTRLGSGHGAGEAADFVGVGLLLELGEAVAQPLRVAIAAVSVDDS